MLTCFAQWWIKGGSQHPFLHGPLLRKSHTVASLAHKCGTRHPTQGRAVQGPHEQRVSPQDWPAGVLSYVYWEASGKQSNTGFLSNQASVMFKARSAFPPIPQQAPSALPRLLGSRVVQGRSSSIAAGLQDTMYRKRCCCKQDGWWRKMVLMGVKSRTPAQTVALRQVSRGLGVILWEGV